MYQQAVGKYKNIATHYQILKDVDIVATYHNPTSQDSILKRLHHTRHQMLMVHSTRWADPSRIRTNSGRPARPTPPTPRPRSPAPSRTCHGGPACLMRSESSQDENPVQERTESVHKEKAEANEGGAIAPLEFNSLLLSLSEHHLFEVLLALDIPSLAKLSRVSTYTRKATATLLPSVLSAHGFSLNMPLRLVHRSKSAIFHETWDEGLGK
eukprot:4877742-Pleurochrysis_carterae.AAC.1